MILFVYASLIFLVLRFSVTLFNFLSNPKLGHYGKHFNDLVSVICLENGWEGELDSTVLALKSQDYANIEVLIKRPHEKRSDLIENARGRYFLFLKGDLILKNGFINNLIFRTKLYDLAMISVVPDRRFLNWWGYCFHPLKDFLLMSVFPMRLVRLVNIPAFFVASQSCMFFDAETYRLGMKANNTNKTKMELLQANKFVILNETSRFLNVGKDLMKVFGNNFFVAFIYLTLVLAGPAVMLLNFQLSFLVLPFGLVFLMRVMLSFLSGQKPVLNILLHPVQMIILAFVIIREGFFMVFTVSGHKK